MTDLQPPSYSLQNSFISTLDHLPCDIIRSLWLIQSCNIKIDGAKQDLQSIINSYSETKQISNEQLQNIVRLKEVINYLTSETIQELKALNNQLITHKLSLTEEINQLNQINCKKETNIQQNQEALRKQLKRHYKEHPLRSQREAIEEQKEIAKKKDTTTDGSKSGIKLILKLPKNDTVIKPKHQIVKKDEKVKKKVVTKKKKPIKVQKVVEVEVEDEESDEDEDNSPYCFCNQPSFGDMIACDNEESCPNGEWFHYKCVGLLNRVEALKYTTGKTKWFCSPECQKIVEEKGTTLKEKKRRKRRRKW
ncbi:unnamed protein product [Candida verbasci]|uniref:Zinc finger PHD-type domain-containing protein n=1 Tax=Candida verbasci TaxID=1227364 RepID=A0A9W4TVC7_9ASCO|nr:unnamed protein product [Candida verbasci]